ncbi:CLK4-associating serine/arginine rich protein isoform X1 [Diorhabda sublineata]|uniref:CLK4-associating serine/arginine rich protein isoform X1 n=1 Tax=Diorhabda sublineata TaxID=1163346 RepID=UPI0024E141E8|nr:CLK4-associating serine/arginine rich protein isoform X1 [Diorhabda sublineata]XP_056645997.1 CLK4-associating serine/arginine rich protein isoform X1 [Diorhabda sublineata]XP_056645998.1 CLK4-associating serine/arginine rich protein isoform X1 [Diorhabda sublineata]
MWHEARRQERKIRGMLVDYRRRAERRRDFYEKIKADPTQFLQIHGRQCKIHIDPNIAAAADNAVMMPWQGQADNLIDRFDVRAHLDHIPQISRDEEEKLTQEERHLNYERYRIIAQNSFLGATEEKFLKQLHLEEQFGYTEVKYKKDVRTGATIGYNYEDGTVVPTQNIEGSDHENSDSDLDVDLAINVSKMDTVQANEMNKHGRSYGMSSNDFYSFLINDLEEAEAVKLAREEEQEKALFSGRKSRRERRYHREKRLANRTISPPSYAAKTSPTLLNLRESKSKSRTRSPSPDNSGKITYITFFGEDEETPSSSKATYSSKVKLGKPKSKAESTELSPSKRRSRSRSKDKYSNRVTRFYRNRSRRRSLSQSRSRSRSYKRRRSSSSRSKSRSRSRSRKSKSNSIEKFKSFRRHRSSSSSSSSDTSTTSSSTDTLYNSSKSSPDKNLLSSENSIDPPTKMVPRYYGRNKNDKSSSELTDEEEEMNKPGDNSQCQTNNSNLATSNKKQSVNLKITERLKRKRQALLNRQYKADKIAAQMKTERERLEQQTREDELREMAIKLRKRQREKRHANDSLSSSDSDSSRSDNSINRRKSRGSSTEQERDHSRRHDTRKYHYRREDVEKKDYRSSTGRRSISIERKRGSKDVGNEDQRSWTSSSNKGSRDRSRDNGDKVSTPIKRNPKD